MKRYLLDTGIASDFVHRRMGVFERARRTVQPSELLGVATPVLGELWLGVEGSASRKRNEARLRHQLSHFKIWPFDDSAAREFGRLGAELKRIGRPMQQIDIQIAAVALSLGNCTVVSRDSDLFAVPGLQVVDWSKNDSS